VLGGIVETRQDWRIDAMCIAQHPKRRAYLRTPDTVQIKQRRPCATDPIEHGTAREVDPLFDETDRQVQATFANSVCTSFS
jgi:hypothetical protein